jgi:hypothetical protein
MHVSDPKGNVIEDISQYESGRIVYDETGLLLSVAMWPEEKRPSPALGPSFDDGAEGDS